MEISEGKGFAGTYYNKIINEFTPKTLLCMKMSEKFKIEEEDERAIPLQSIGEGECPGDIQVIEPRSWRVAHRRSHSYVEERFCPMTKILDFAAICNKKRFSEWTHKCAPEKCAPAVVGF